jgi:hypothetical protein
MSRNRLGVSREPLRTSVARARAVMPRGEGVKDSSMTLVSDA